MTFLNYKSYPSGLTGQNWSFLVYQGRPFTCSTYPSLVSLSMPSLLDPITLHSSELLRVASDILCLLLLPHLNMSSSLPEHMLLVFFWHFPLAVKIQLGFHLLEVIPNLYPSHALLQQHGLLSTKMLGILCSMGSFLIRAYTRLWFPCGQRPCLPLHHCVFSMQQSPGTWMVLHTYLLDKLTKWMKHTCSKGWTIT